MINAALHYHITQSDLTLVLALVRGKTLARAAELLGVDVSTVFRSIRRLEAAVGTVLFEKNRSGYLPGTTALALAQQAEAAESALQVAQISLQQGHAIVSGTVRLTCTEAVLQDLLVPALRQFMPNYPGLKLELNTSSAFANLSHRDADIALRLTLNPPQHLVGTCLGSVRYRVVASADYLQRKGSRSWVELDWVGPDDFLPDHSTVVWRRQQYPDLLPAYRCSSMLGVAQLVRAGLGVAALPEFMLSDGSLQALGEPLEGCDAALWLLTRPDCRRLRTVSTLFKELSKTLCWTR
ncbi:LysR family transcriptional regulator [Pseudomonas sp. nanlin1]|uniref:LysR family transcriptional regulator n=1 Tax=Pseudomonas sp. nanlin1 TaxID=3040605 RepID=UPI003890BB02